MRNALDEPQTIVVLGGTSDIGLAIAKALSGPATRHVVLACRDTKAGVEAADALALGPAEVTVVAFEANDVGSHPGFVDDLAERFGDLDVVVLAFGVLGDQATFDADPVAAAAAVTTNYSGAVSVGLAVAARLRAQGHGDMVVLSSVAGERVRRANFVYGSSKAGLDAFAQGLGDSLAGSGARVLVVRPGFVASSMTAGLDPAPMATTPDAVAAAVVKGLRAGRRTIWVPGALRVVFAVFRHLPGPVWRRMPLR
jgi:decaprenylphospho-beta-D-erythro-pentofuranosid-2-ulose 2-reductase